MVIPFDTTKVVQAAEVLIKAHEGRISRLRLLKLLYIADREALRETLRPITGDRVVAMDHGPVLTRTYDLVKSQSPDSDLWNRHIKCSGPQDLELVETAGNGKLSKYEMEKLNDVSERHRRMNDYDIAIETHEFAEWRRNQPDRGKSRLIPLAHILEAIQLTDRQEELEKSLANELELDRLLGGTVP